MTILEQGLGSFLGGDTKATVVLEIDTFTIVMILAGMLLVGILIGVVLMAIKNKFFK